MKRFILQSKAISDGTRVRILKLLEEGELCVCQVMEVLEMGQSTVSKHLGILRMAGLVQARKEGTWSFYRLADEHSREYNSDFLVLLKKSLSKDSKILSDKARLKELTAKNELAACK